MQERLAADELVVSMTLYQARTPDYPMVAAACGFDAINVDLEHSATSLETASMLCTAAIGAGITPFVRVPAHDGHLITRAFDIGAVGVIVPHVEGIDEAVHIVEYARFPPVGSRSVFGTNPVTRYEPLPPGELLRQLENQAIIAAMVESPPAIDAIDGIAAVEGLDMIIVGPHDLSAEYGALGRLDDQVVLDALDSVARACVAHNKIFGVAGISDLDLLADLMRRGLRFVSAGTDMQFFTEAAMRRVGQLRDVGSPLGPRASGGGDLS